MALSVGCLLLGLGYAGADSKKDEAAKYTRDLKAKSENDRITAIKGIAEIGRLKAVYAKDAVVPLTEMVKKDSSAKIRAEAATALGAIDPEDYQPVVEALAEALKDKDDNVMTASASALGSLGAKAKDALPALKEASAKVKNELDDVKDDKKKAQKFKNQQKAIGGALKAIQGAGK